MPRFRVYYTERTIGQSDVSPDDTGVYKGPGTRLFTGSRSYVHATEWEDGIDAKDVDAALEEFFNQHAGGMENVMWLDEYDESHPATGLRYDRTLSYIWMEGDRLMEYQGLDEIVAGRVVCPFCNGKGVTDESVVEEYREAWDDRPDHFRADIVG